MSMAACATRGEDGRGDVHELYDEPEKDQILGFTLAWLNTHA